MWPASHSQSKLGPSWNLLCQHLQASGAEEVLAGSVRLPPTISAVQLLSNKLWLSPPRNCSPHSCADHTRSMKREVGLKPFWNTLWGVSVYVVFSSFHLIPPKLFPSRGLSPSDYYCVWVKDFMLSVPLCCFSQGRGANNSLKKELWRLGGAREERQGVMTSAAETPWGNRVQHE